MEIAIVFSPAATAWNKIHSHNPCLVFPALYDSPAFSPCFSVAPVTYLSLESSDPVNDEAALLVVDEAEVLVGLVDGHDVWEKRRKTETTGKKREKKSSAHQKCFFHSRP